MLIDHLAGDVDLIQVGAFLHSPAQGLDVAGQPANKRGVDSRRQDGAGSLRATGLTVILVHQVDHMTAAQNVFGRNEVGQRSTGTSLTGLGHPIAHVGHDHGRELHQFIGIMEGHVQLVTVDGDMVLPHVLAVEVELHRLGLFDGVHVSRVTIVPKVGSGFIVALVRLKFIVCQL